LKNEVSERIRFFSDEKIFTDAKINRRNNQWLDYNSEDIPIVARTKFLANVHMLGIVSSESDIMPPHSIMSSLSLKKEELSQKKFLMDVVKMNVVNGKCGLRKAICFSAEWCISSYESFDSKLVLRQRRYVLI